MKYIDLYILIILFWMNSINAYAQLIRAESKSININNTPELVIEKVTLKDENNNKEVDAGEMCFLEIVIRNSGEGVAQTVNVDALLDTPPVKGFSYENSVYAGNMIEGKEYTFKLKLFPQISLQDGFVRLKIEALETNGYNSKPKYIRLNLRSKKQSFAIGWMNPFDDTTTVYVPEIGVKCCVISNEPVKEIKIFMNGEIHSDRGNMKLIKSNECDYEFETNLKLREGVNHLYIELGNGKEWKRSETRFITFTKVRMENRLALVIGNGKYSKVPLRNPPNDARDMAAALRELKFDVIELIDGTLQQMMDSILKFTDQLNEKKGVGLFYFSGHGVQVNDENFLLPVKHNIQQEKHVEYQAVGVNTVLKYMQESGTRMNIVILDACRDYPFPRRNRSSTRGLAKIYAEGSGSIIAYATSPGSVADDGDRENGLYTEELLKVMKTPGLEIGIIFRRVLTNVKNNSNGEQKPWISASIEGEFYFKK